MFVYSEIWDCTFVCNLWHHKESAFDIEIFGYQISTWTALKLYLTLHSLKSKMFDQTKIMKLFSAIG